MANAPATTGDLIQVMIQGRIEEQECENVIYFSALANDTDFWLHLLTEVMNCFVLNVLPVLASTYRFERVVGRRIAPTIGPDFVVTRDEGQNVLGQASGDAEPSFVSALISLRSVRGGRSGRGRMYIAGVPEVATVASHIDSNAALYAALVTFTVCLIQKFHPKDTPQPGDYTWGVFSRKIGGAKAPFNASGFAAIQSAEVSTQLATTRSRKISRGR